MGRHHLFLKIGTDIDKWLGSVVVGCRTSGLEVASSIPGRSAAR